jgi:hypothetical protein
MNTKEMLAVFKKIVGGLLKQGTQSMDRTESTCKYRGTNGMRCAIGMIISDSAYKRSLEGSTIMSTDNTRKSKLIKALVDSGIDVSTPADIEFLAEMQEIHDSAYGRPWIENFTSAANSHLGMSKTAAKALVDSLRPKTGTYAKGKKK